MASGVTPSQLATDEAAYVDLTRLAGSGSVDGMRVLKVLNQLPALLGRMGLAQTLATLKGSNDAASDTVLALLEAYAEKFNRRMTATDFSAPMQRHRALARYVDSLLTFSPLLTDLKPVKHHDASANARALVAAHLRDLDQVNSKRAWGDDTLSNGGLKFEKFFHLHTARAGNESNWRREWAGAFCTRQHGDGHQLKRHHEALKRLVEESLSGTVLPVVTSSELAIGLGLSNPAENGLLWHPTLAVPYIPASSVKGMLRAWMTTWGTDDDRANVDAWFGTAEDAGELIFFDALPADPVQLKVEVMTPHWGAWGEGPGEADKRWQHVPADWHDPKPVHFLMVDSGTRFNFLFASRGPDARELLDRVQDSLVDALTYMGTGAKTAVGYGRFELPVT